MNDSFNRFTHVALPRMNLPNPIPGRARLRGPAPDIIQRDRTQKRPVIPPRQEQRHGGSVRD